MKKYQKAENINLTKKTQQFKAKESSWDPKLSKLVLLTKRKVYHEKAFTLPGISAPHLS